MSRKLFSRNEDLQRLRADGYFVQVVDEKFLVVRQVPYVNERREVALGTLVTPLELAGDITRQAGPLITWSCLTANFPATHRARS